MIHVIVFLDVFYYFSLYQFRFSLPVFFLFMHFGAQSARVLLHFLLVLHIHFNPHSTGIPNIQGTAS